MIALYELLKFAVRNRGVEGLPLKYVIIILVAVIVIGIAVMMATKLGGGIGESMDIINDTIVQKVNESMNFSA